MPIFVIWNDKIVIVGDYLSRKITYMTKTLICWYRDSQGVSVVMFLFQVTTILIGWAILVMEILFLSLCLRIVTWRE